MTNRVSIDYQPREVFLPFHQRAERWSCIVAHRRCGKTFAVINDMVAKALYTDKKNPRYAYVAPLFRQARDIAWQYLKDATLGLTVKVRESQLRVELVNGAWITLYGADNPDSLRGIYLDGVILDEYGDCRPSLWGEVILPTLADRKGWAVLIGTPKGVNHFYKIYQRSLVEDNWFHATFRASETGLLPDTELREMAAQMDKEQYRQEMECDFSAAVKGTYYASTLERISENGQITVVPWQSDSLVHVALDLGYTDSTAIWFWQDTPTGPAVIDFAEAHSQPLDYYFDLLNGKPYSYGTMWLPHDARAKTLQTGRSTIEQFLNQGWDVKIVPRLSVQQGIDASRYMLNICTFDEVRCANGLEGLRAYRRKWNEVAQRYTDTPLHDWASNPADAFRYLALVARDRYADNMVEVDIPTDDTPAAPELTLDKMWEEHGRTINLAGNRI